MPGLRAYFDGIATKVLSEVEVNPARSNQHEFNGVAQLKPLLGTQNRRREIFARHFDLDDRDVAGVVKLTWYDARFDHPRRSEWRLYYSAELAPSLRVGARIVLAKRAEEFFLFTSHPNTGGSAALGRLFGGELTPAAFVSVTNDDLSEMRVSTIEQLVLAELGLVTDDELPLVQRLFDRFGAQFPRGEELSSFVRQNTFGVDAVVDPDEALTAWARVELELFNSIESEVESMNMIEAEGLEAKLEVAMRIFQRRRSRAGKAFEYHLRAIFDANGISYSANPTTESREEPDFIFPSIENYRDVNWPVERLAMLAAKQTLRDRWRQILNEAARVEHKHLATLDLNISRNQVIEIERAGIQLVIPRSLHERYDESMSSYFWTLADFINWVRALQSEL